MQGKGKQLINFGKVPCSFLQDHDKQINGIFKLALAYINNDYVLWHQAVEERGGKMIISLSRRNLLKHGKLSLKLLLLIVLIIYLLPKLLLVFWNITCDPKINEQRVPEKPLKVISQSIFNI